MREILTAYDVVQQCMDFLGGKGTSVTLRAMKQSLNTSLRTVLAAVKSPYMLKQGRLHLVAPITTGTITYDHTGGASERLVTFTDAHGISSTDILDYSIIIDNKICDIESYVDATNVTLDLALNPGADQAAGTSYTLVKRYYRLPDDFDETEGFVGEYDEVIGEETSMQDVLHRCRMDPSTGTPVCYAIAGIQDQINAVGMFPYPFSDAVRTMDYLYYRKAREINYTGHDESACRSGTVATSGTTVTGTDTAFASRMVGSIIRFSSSITIPTGFSGANPFTAERLIHTVGSTTSLVIDRALSSELSGTALLISDPIDIDPVLYDLYVTSCLVEMSSLRDMPAHDRLVQSYQSKLFAAKTAINRAVQPSPARSYSSGGRTIILTAND
jgi:hypothetical protein